LVGSFFIPNVFFEYYGWVALGASGLFILVQLVILVDFAHSWAENWIEKRDDFIEEGMNRWMVALLVASIILYCFSIAATIVMYVFFSSCQMNLAFISINLVLCIVMTITSLHPKVQEHSESSGILQASIISAYCTYLAWSSLMSEPVDFRPDGLQCNPRASDVGTSASSNITVIIGAVITIIALVYTTIRVAISVGNNDLESQPLTKEEKEIESEMDKEEDVKSVNKDDPVEYSFVKFHLIFVLGSMYLAMLMSDWQTVAATTTSNGVAHITVDSGIGAVWVKIVSSWIAVGLYIWTLIGPVLFPDRDWSRK